MATKKTNDGYKQFLFSNDFLNKLQYSILYHLYESPQSNLKVYFNDKKKATTIISDDRVVVVKCKKGEKYNRRLGFLEAYFELKSGMSKTQKNKYLNKILKENK